MATTKIIKKDVFTAIIEKVVSDNIYLDIIKDNETVSMDPEQIAEFFTHEIELLNRKREAKENKINPDIVDCILAFLKSQPHQTATCSEIMKMLNSNTQFNFEKEISLPKMTSIMTKICGTVSNPLPNAPVVREKNKKITTFKYVG